MVLPVRSVGSSARLPMLFVPRPCPIQRHFGSPRVIPSSERQIPPPAVPTQSRHLPIDAQAGDTSRAETRPDTVSSGSDEESVVSGPRLSQAPVVPGPAPRTATPWNTQYFTAFAAATCALPGSPG